MPGVELICINLGESDICGGKKSFSKNLHLPHLLHPSKLREDQSSFEGRCTFGKTLLHPTRTFRTRWGCFIDDLDTPEQPAAVNCCAIIVRAVVRVKGRCDRRQGLSKVGSHEKDVPRPRTWIPAPVSGHGAGSVSEYGASARGQATTRVAPTTGLPGVFFRVMTVWGFRDNGKALSCGNLPVLSRPERSTRQPAPSSEGQLPSGKSAVCGLRREKS